MLKDGTYAAWFKTALGQGTGIVHLAHGKIWGRDSAVVGHDSVAKWMEIDLPRPSRQGGTPTDCRRYSATIRNSR